MKPKVILVSHNFNPGHYAHLVASKKLFTELSCEVYSRVHDSYDNNEDFNLSLAGTGGSDLPNLKAEFTDIAHTRGVLSAARSADPDSANSQFFICFDSAPHLDRQYSAFGKVLKGMEFIDMIKKGDPNSGSVPNPDKIISLKSK